MDSQVWPLVSVVTPVYNGEKHLAECIESVLAQTYENWEYVIVNNCSTDRSLEIAQHYAQLDSRIRVHNNREFLALMQNWNHALRQISAASKCFKVVHADDWLFPECIMEMVKVAEANPSVGIVGSYVLEGIRVKCDGLPYPSTVVPGRELCRLSLLRGGPYVFGSPTSLLIRSDRIQSRKTFYNESSLYAGVSNIYADVEACYDVLQNSDFGFVHRVLTYTRLHDKSQTSIYQRLNTSILGKLAVLTKYGPGCLGSKEYEERLGQRMQGYYAFLGRTVLERGKKEVWNYHREGLKNLGFSLSWAKLAGATIIELYRKIVNYLLHPKATAQSIIGFVRGTESRKSLQR
ncbi:MAG: glycosyltransferase family 2 protein [Chloroflexi bacterium]|nr:glycosyltransferase family 2 protein [Chloroflexota bacterium]